MWQKVLEEFKNKPSRLKVARLLLEYGFRVDEDGIYAGPVPLSVTKLAKACGVDRKVVEETASNIRANETLMKVFHHLKPVADISDVAKFNKTGFGGLIEVEAFSSSVGIAAKAASLLAENGLVIRYMLCKDPELSVKSTMTIVTDKKIPVRVVRALLDHPDILKVSLS